MSLNEKVLVVESSSFMVNLMQRQVENGGFEAKATVKPYEALEIAHKWTPAVALIDIDLPQGQAFELIQGLTSKYPSLKIIGYSSGHPETIWEKIHPLGAYKFLQKPISKQDLLDALHQVFRSGDHLSLVKSANVLESPASQPFEIHMKSCYICGHDHVKFFAPKADSFFEDWAPGLWPKYYSEGDFEEWDFLKTMISVCPRCFFASTDIRDFSEADEVANYPYKPDAKKLLTLGISARRKIAGVSPEIEVSNIFDSPYRSNENVIKTFLLAEKCGNGLILGDKPGAHVDIGMLYTIRACIEQKPDIDTLIHAQDMFYNQLKIPFTSRDARIKTFYFIIATHFALSESIKANEMKEQLENFYLENKPEEASMHERIWNARLLQIWQDGLANDLNRKIGR